MSSACGEPLRFTLHNTEALARIQLHQIRRDASQLTLLAYIVWFGGGLGGLLMAIGMHWGFGLLGVGLGLGFTVLMQRMTGLSAEVTRTIAAARAGDNDFARPAMVVLRPESLEVGWPGRTVRVAWSWISVKSSPTHTILSSPWFRGPLAVVQADHPILPAMAALKRTESSFTSPPGTRVVATFDHSKDELIAVQDAREVGPRLFRRLLALTVLLGGAAVGALATGMLTSGAGLLILSSIFGLTGTAEYWTRWLWPPNPIPADASSRTRVGLYDGGWWLGTDYHHTTLRWVPGTRVESTDTHLIVLDPRQDVAIPKDSIADPSFADTLRSHIAAAERVHPGPQRFADDPEPAPDSPYALPRSQGPLQ